MHIFSPFFKQEKPSSPLTDDEWIEVNHEDCNPSSSVTKRLTAHLEQLSTTYQQALDTAGPHPMRVLSDALNDTSQSTEPHRLLAHRLISCYNQLTQQLSCLTIPNTKPNTQVIIGPSLATQFQQLNHYYAKTLRQCKTPDHLIKAFKLAATLAMFNQENQQFNHHLSSHSARK